MIKKSPRNRRNSLTTKTLTDVRGSTGCSVSVSTSVGANQPVSDSQGTASQTVTSSGTVQQSTSSLPDGVTQLFLTPSAKLRGETKFYTDGVRVFHNDGSGSLSVLGNLEDFQ